MSRQQMLVLLAEALQELFFPWVEACAGPLAALSTASPHEDVRSYAMAGVCDTAAPCVPNTAQNAS